MDNSDAIKEPGEVGVATDDSAALFWYQEAVEFAMGEVRAFEDMSNPQYYGDLYSFLVRTGARARRADYAGIAILQEDASV